MCYADGTEPRRTRQIFREPDRTAMTYASALSALSKLGDLNRPDYEPQALEEWWRNSALTEYETLELLPRLQLEHLRSLTWRLLARSAAMIALDVSRPAPPYCQQLAARDQQVRHLLDFDGLVDLFVDASRSAPDDAPQYERSPRQGGAAGERLRAFAMQEVVRTPETAEAVHPRHGLAAPVLMASAPLDGPGSAVGAWQECRERLRLDVEAKLVAMAWLCQVGRKLRAFPDIKNPRKARHAAHGILASASQALLVLQEGRAGMVVPYWRAPLRLRADPPEMPRLLAHAAYLVARIRVEKKSVNEEEVLDHLKEVVTIVERALAAAGPAPLGRGWLTQQELEGALQALRLGGGHASICRHFCSY